MTTYTIGLDFGTETARAVLVEVGSGEIVATAVHAYPHGVIDQVLPVGDVPLAADWALQHPRDWLEAATVTVPAVLKESGVAPEDVAGLGIDFTACTVLPVLKDGTPLCEMGEHRSRPHAWAKLWKHHAAQPQADRVNALATERNEAWLPRYGGKISSEWLIPKALELLEEAPDLYETADYLVEGSDWVVRQLSGSLARNACAAGYKGTWHKQDGFPTADFLAALHPALATLYTEKLAGEVVAPGSKVGGLTAGWAERLGLAAGTPVAAAIIDAHAAALGGGVSAPGTMFMIMGTSTCHMLVAGKEVLVEGISGVVEDGIVPHLFGYEAGQAGVGDIFAWFVKHATPPAYHEEAAARGVSLHHVLAEKAEALRPGKSGLLALDWWNGCRTPLVDADLNGVIVGYSLQTTAVDIYRALIEATAFGTRLIVELFAGAGVPLERLRAGGGLTKNDPLLQIYVDVIGLPLEITASEQTSALGAAILGAVGAGVYPTLQTAVAAMAPPPSRTVVPQEAHLPTYDALYAEYKRLVDLFGRGADSPLKRLRTLRPE